MALVASALLIGASLLEIGGGAALVGPLLLLAVVLAAVRNRVPQPGWRFGQNVDLYLRDLWVGPALAAVATALVFGATPAEVQTVGGLLGFLGMVNYFLRPVYHVVYSFVESAVQKVA